MIISLDTQGMYVTQLWRKDKENGYIVASLTKEEKEQSMLVKSFKNIICQK